jgi:hypothetical protein
LAQCQNNYISPFSELSACIVDDAKRKSMGIVNTYEKINPILIQNDNINILHTEKDNEDGAIKAIVKKFNDENQPLKIYYGIPNKNKKGTEKYGGVDETDKTMVLASTAGWQNYFENKDNTSVKFVNKYFMPVWNKNVMTHPEDFDDKTTITRQITDNLNDLFPGATLINEIKSIGSGGSRFFRTKKKTFHPKTTTEPPEFTRTKAAKNAHTNFTLGNKLPPRNTGNRVRRLSKRGNQPTSNHSPRKFRGVQALYKPGNPIYNTLKFNQTNVSGTLNRSRKTNQSGYVTPANILNKNASGRIVYTPSNHTKKNKNGPGQNTPQYSTTSNKHNRKRGHTAYVIPTQIPKNFGKNISSNLKEPEESEPLYAEAE